MKTIAEELKEHLQSAQSRRKKLREILDEMKGVTNTSKDISEFEEVNSRLIELARTYIKTHEPKAEDFADEVEEGATVHARQLRERAIEAFSCVVNEIPLREKDLTNLLELLDTQDELLDAYRRKVSILEEQLTRIASNLAIVTKKRQPIKASTGEERSKKERKNAIDKIEAVLELISDGVSENEPQLDKQISDSVTALLKSFVQVGVFEMEALKQFAVKHLADNLVITQNQLDFMASIIEDVLNTKAFTKFRGRERIKEGRRLLSEAVKESRSQSASNPVEGTDLFSDTSPDSEKK
jgi:hypothetical protein